MVDLGKAIRGISETANFIINNENVDTIQWLDGVTPIAKEDILAKQIELQAAEDAAVAQLVTDKASAVSKLEALGLSSSEIDALKQ